jgi:Tfp pilus assembly protein PilO
MLKPFFSIALIILAIISYFMGIRPMSDQIKAVRLDRDKQKETLKKGNEIKGVIEQMKVSADSVTEKDEASLTALLPDKIEIVKKALDLQSLTASSSSKKPLVLIGSVGGTEGTVMAGESGQNYSTFTINFNVIGTYESLKRFLVDIAKNKVVSDIESLSFGGAESTGGASVGPELFRFNISLKTYWLPSGRVVTTAP